MAVFSFEYLLRECKPLNYDFSIVDAFNNLDDGYGVDLVCDGFGCTKILREGNRCLLWLPKTEEYFDLAEVLGFEKYVK